MQVERLTVKRESRVETGPVEFTYEREGGGIERDWRGVFIRGDNAFGFALALRTMLNGDGDALTRSIVEGLESLLVSSDERSGR